MTKRVEDRRSAAVCAAVVPQQPPTIRAPAASHVRARSAYSSGETDLDGSSRRRAVGPEVAVGGERHRERRAGERPQVREQAPRRDAIDRDRVGPSGSRAPAAACGDRLAGEKASRSRPSPPRRRREGPSLRAARAAATSSRTVLCVSTQDADRRPRRRATSPAARAPARAAVLRGRGPGGSSLRAERASPRRRSAAATRRPPPARERPRARSARSDCAPSRPLASVRRCVRNVLAVRMSAPASTSSRWISRTAPGESSSAPRSRAGGCRARRGARAPCPSRRRAAAAGPRQTRRSAAGAALSRISRSR